MPAKPTRGVEGIDEIVARTGGVNENDTSETQCNYINAITAMDPDPLTEGT